MSCSRHMSQATAGGAITERTSTKTTVYSGDRMLKAFMDTCEAALVYLEQRFELNMPCDSSSSAALDPDAASDAMPAAVPVLMRYHMWGGLYTGRKVT